MIVASNQVVCLVGAGPVAPRILSEVATIAPILVAADGGASRLLRAGLVPVRTIGDLDSLPEADRARLPAGSVVKSDDQVTTDLEKCLAEITAPLIIGLGFLDGRLDHSLAALSALTRNKGQRVLLIGRQDLCFHASHDQTLDLVRGTRVSLYPIAPISGKSDGLEWPIDGLSLSPLGRIGTSNRALGRVRLQISGDGLIVILPQSAWRRAALALWPAFRGGSHKALRR